MEQANDDGPEPEEQPGHIFLAWTSCYDNLCMLHCEDKIVNGIFPQRTKTPQPLYYVNQLEYHAITQVQITTEGVSAILKRTTTRQTTCLDLGEAYYQIPAIFEPPRDRLAEKPSQLALCATQRDNNSAHLEIPVTINGRVFTAMIDSGAQGNYISPSIVNQEQLEWDYKEDPYRLSTVEGSEVTYKNSLIIQETAQLPVRLPGKDEYITFDITDIADHELILGIPWLRNSNPVIDWTIGQLLRNTAAQRQVIQEMEELQH